jgi:hypothetical protein
LKDQLIAGFDNVFPPLLFDQMINEAKKVADYVDRQREGFMHGKKQTYFVDMRNGEIADHVPRFALERAIEMLIKLDYPTEEERKEIYGAEWWVQRRAATENIGFHYDKDEAAASLHSLLKCPTEGTITYMTSDGSPTVIMNRTTPQGNDPDPMLVVSKLLASLLCFSFVLSLSIAPLISSSPTTRHGQRYHIRSPIGM